MKGDSFFERVYVELVWYDGPREGVADVLGVPSRFKSLFDDEWLGNYFIWPISQESLALEVEAWSIFVGWNKLYENGDADTGSHPGVGGINQRYDEIEELLRAGRNSMHDEGCRATAEFLGLERDNRYEIDGPDYELKWSVLDDI